MKPRIRVDQVAIAAFCQKWRITRLELFGSAVRDDFGPESDVDVLVSFERGESRDLFDLLDMQRELESIFGRMVDLLTRRAVEASRNPYRKEAILSGAAALYEA